MLNPGEQLQQPTDAKHRAWTGFCQPKCLRGIVIGCSPRPIAEVALSLPGCWKAPAARQEPPHSMRSELSFQKLTCIGLRTGRDLFGGSLAQYLPTALATLWPQIDHIVSGLNHIQVVLDHQHSMPCIHEAVQAFQQMLNIRQMEARGRLIQNIENLSSPLPLAQFLGQLYPLGLPPPTFPLHLPHLSQTNP